MTRLSLVKVVADRDALGMWLPWYWGYSWTDYSFRVQHFAIVPLNWVIGLWVRWVRPFLQRGYRDHQWEAAVAAASDLTYLQGYRDGQRAAEDTIRKNVWAFIEGQREKRNI